MDQHWITKTCHHKTADFLFLIDICWTGITQNSYVLLNLWKHIYTNWIPPPPHQCFISQNAEETVMRSHVCTRSKVLQWTLWSVLYSRVNTPPQCFIYCRCFSCETKQQWQTRRTKCRMPESERIWRDDTIGHTSPLCIYAKLNTCSVTTLILQQNPSKMAQKYTQTASIRRTDVHYLILLKYYRVAVVFF